MTDEETARFRELLTSLRATLQEHGGGYGSDLVDDALAGNTARLEAFLTSNDLWGGSGSIADSAGSSGERDEGRRKVEAALVALGEEQLRIGLKNERTDMWVGAFRKWQRDGI